ncbi:hypothetical protein DPM19_01455 [Actinomadura craniellae]|uniref:Uncharacterized protein n=1 Tax=Actinomadura craniellae TaxID=2231787 RepID=A0A365HCM9_9ACTN|nr:hypothetical protein DPM19_01455 [Actinomadura craniellae]
MLFLLFGSFFGAFYFLLTPDADAGYALVAGVLGGLFFALVMGAFLRIARGRDRAVTGDLSRADAVEVARAGRTGELPAERDLDGPMLDLIKRRREQYRRSSVSGPLVLGAIALLHVGNALNTGVGWWWAGAALMVTLLVWTRVQAQRNLAKLDRLETAINSRPHDPAK